MISGLVLTILLSKSKVCNNYVLLLLKVLIFLILHAELKQLRDEKTIIPYLWNSALHVCL